MLLAHGGDSVEANDYLEDGLLREISRLMQLGIGYAMLFDVKNDNASGMEMMRWIIPTLEGLKKTQEPCFLDRYNAVLLAVLAGFQIKSGEKEEAVRSLRQACALARSFDAAPNYEMDRVKFVSRVEAAHDSLGETAMEALENALQYLDPELRDCWKEVSGYEE